MLSKGRHSHEIFGAHLHWDQFIIWVLLALLFLIFLFLFMTLTATPAQAQTCTGFHSALIGGQRL